MCRRRAQKGQEDQALGRSRGGFSTKIHLKVDLGGLPLAFHLTGGEASDSRNFEILLDLGPDINPRAPLGDKGYDSKSNREDARQRIDPTPKTSPPTSRKHSTRREHALNKRLASSSASSVSPFDAKRRRKITARSSLSLFILIKSVHTA
jgi:hypothetical protein